MILFLLIPLVAMFAVLGFFGLLFPHVGRIWFAIFAAWWWPWRNESAATMLAAALEKDEEWRQVGYEGRTLSSGSLKASIESTFDGELTLTVAGDCVPLSRWDDFKLGFAVSGWRARNDARAARRSGEITARILRENLKKWDTQEKAR